MTGLNLGTTAISAVHLGTVPVTAMYYGSTRVWGGAAVDTAATDFLGTLYNWFIDFSGSVVSTVTGLGGQANTILSSSIGSLQTGTGTLVGALGKFVPSIDTSSGNWGTIISSIPASLQSSICSGISALGGLFSSGGLVGFLNGLPVIGTAFSWIEQLLSGGGSLSSITSLIGGIPVVQSLASLVGILQNATTGFMNNPVNFILDNLGSVMGTLSCGTFTTSSAGHTAGLSSGTVTYPIGSIGTMYRLLIPDGLVSLSPQTGWSRSQNLTADDGWMEMGIATSGNAGYATRVFRRYDNTGAYASGVGVHLMDGLVSIIRRVGSTDTLVAPAISQYSPGNVIRLTQVGNTHTVFRNGAQVGQWIDSGNTALIGSTHRSVGMAMTGAQDLMGPRSFSPALRFVRAA